MKSGRAVTFLLIVSLGCLGSPLAGAATLDEGTRVLLAATAAAPGPVLQSFVVPPALPDAVRAGTLFDIRRLIDAGADRSAALRREAFLSPAILAALQGSAAALAADAGTAGDSDLVDAAGNGDVARIAGLLGARFDAEPLDDDTCLCAAGIAVTSGHPELAGVLLAMSSPR
jgi:hypothetical protein